MQMTAIPSAMAFYHADGLIPAWKQATAFAGKNGRIATMQDIVDLRIATGPGNPAWEKYYTSSSSEFFGRGKNGDWLIIVAHGVGPMATLDGACKAYSHQYDDKSRGVHGGRITQQEFLDLEAGHYGEVHIVDFASLLARYPNGYATQDLTESQALAEPLLNARFGARAEAYIKRHAEIAREWHKSEGHGTVSDPIIIKMDDADNCHYGCKEFPPRVPEGLAYAHLLSTGGFTSTLLWGHQHPSLLVDIGGHGWHNGTRLAGIRAGSALNNIHPGVNFGKLIEKKWKEVLIPVVTPEPIGFRLLMKSGDEWFTTQLKKGDGMDSYIPEFHVLSIKAIGEPQEFTTTIGGYHGFFKYGIKEVEAIKPPDANGYSIVGGIEIVYSDASPTRHKTKVQFYRAEVDPTQRLMLEKQILSNNDLLMRLLFQPEQPSTVSLEKVEAVAV